MLASLALPLALALSAPADAAKDKRVVIDRVPPSAIADMLRAKGFEVQEKVDNVGDPLINARGDINMQVLFYDCEAETGCVTAQFRSYWSGDHKVTATDASERMRANRFGRAYLDKDADITFELELTCEGGITIEHVQERLDDYVRNAGKFGKEVVGQE